MWALLDQAWVVWVEEPGDGLLNNLNLELIAPSGRRYHNDDDARETTDSSLSIRVADPGRWRLLVTSYQNRRIELFENGGVVP